MVVESRRHARTWFVTLTSREAVSSYEALRDEFQMWLKRLRKSGLKLRYVAVYERGSKKGRLHMHALIHGSEALRRRDLSGWRLGFMQAKLADRSAIAYVAKYIGKSHEVKARTPCSQSYGVVQFPAETLETVKKVFEAFPSARIVKLRGVDKRSLPKVCGAALRRFVAGLKPSNDEVEARQSAAWDYRAARDGWERREPAARASGGLWPRDAVEQEGDPDDEEQNHYWGD